MYLGKDINIFTDFDPCSHTGLSALILVRWGSTISRLQYHLGIHDIALDWCKSYLLNRPQHVCIGNAISKPVILDYSVPQGSVLGPQWFTIYTSPVRDIILKYNLNY